MQTVKLLLLTILINTPCFADLGGEIGNAFVNFESKIGAYSIEYPESWNRSDLSQVTNFYDPNSAAGKADFLSVMTNQMKSITSEEELLNHLRFFRPEAQWTKVSIAGLNGFRAEIDGVQSIYLLRRAENLLSLRYRAKNAPQNEARVMHMLESFRLL